MMEASDFPNLHKIAVLTYICLVFNSFLVCPFSALILLDYIGRHFPPPKLCVINPEELSIRHNKMNSKVDLHKLKHKHFDDIPNAMNFLRESITVLNEESLKDLVDTLYDRVDLLEKI